MSIPQTSLRERKKDQTRAELLTAALDLIQARGFEQATLVDIAAIANVSPRTLLRYFPTKEDLFVSSVQDAMVQLTEDLARRMPLADPVEALLASARTVLATYGEQAEFFMTIERVIASNPSVGARKEHIVASINADVTVILSDPRNEKPLSRLVADTLSGVVIALLRASIREWLSKDGKVSLPRLFDEVSEKVSVRI